MPSLRNLVFFELSGKIVPGRMVTGGGFVERSCQPVPTRLIASIDPHNATRAGNMDILASPPSAQQRNFYFDYFAWLNPSRCGETYSCFTDIERYQR
jgi:hypothetical protein